MGTASVLTQGSRPMPKASGRVAVIMSNMIEYLLSILDAVLSTVPMNHLIREPLL